MPNMKKKGYSARDLRDVSDNPELTKEDFVKAKPFAEALPELAASIRKGRDPNKEGAHWLALHSAMPRKRAAASKRSS
jgi:hypothetical protein